MITILAILGILAVLMLFAGCVCMAGDHGFFYWFVVLPEIGKAVCYILAALLEIASGD